MHLERKKGHRKVRWRPGWAGAGWPGWLAYTSEHLCPRPSPCGHTAYRGPAAANLPPPPIESTLRDSLGSTNPRDEAGKRLRKSEDSEKWVLESTVLGLHLGSAV